jgi:transposase
MKVFSGMSGRRVQSDLRESAGRGWLGSVGHFNSISNFLDDAASTAILVALIEESAAPLRSIENGQFAIDSTGFSTVTYDRWFDQKHGKLHAQHPWIKLHAMVGTVTHAITGVKVSSEGDCPLLPALVEQTRKRHNVREVSADKAYSSVRNHETLDGLGIAAFIPFKDNAVINPKSKAWSRNLCEFLLNQDKFLPHYHRRSNVESTFAMIKEKFGASVASRRPTAQVNETLCKCLAHNLCCLVKAIFISGLVPTFWPDAAPVPVLTLVVP